MEKILESIKNTFVQLYAKLKDLYLSMTLGNRIVAVLLTATLLVSLGYLIVGSIKTGDVNSKYTKIYNGYEFTWDEARAAENAFASATLAGHQWVGSQLQVPTDKRNAYIAALASANIIDKSAAARQEAVRTLSAMQSARMMDEIMLTAKEKDCIDAIKTLPGIADAKIFKHKRPEWERNVWARRYVFSVNVTVEAIDKNKPLPIETIGAVGRIVGPAFGITDAKDIRREITIVDAKNNRSYNGVGTELIGAQAEYSRHQEQQQSEWNERIRQHLPRFEGIKVQTDVQLTTYRSLKEFEVDHKKPTQLVTHVMGYDFLKEGYDRWARPGQIAQFSRPLIDPTADLGPRDKISEKKHEQEITNALPGLEQDREELPFIPKLITTTITVPNTYILAVWREKNRLNGGDPEAQPTPEELATEQEEFRQATKRSISQILRYYREPGSRVDPMDLVHVEYETLLPEPEVVLTAWERFLIFMKENWQSLGLMSLVFSGMVVLWLISKPPKEGNIVIYEGLDTPIEAIDARLAEQKRLEEERLAAEAAAAEEAEEEFENSLGGLGSIRSLKDEIAELIRQNPEAAAAIIRQWIGNAVLVEAKS